MVFLMAPRLAVNLTKCPKVKPLASKMILQPGAYGSKFEWISTKLKNNPTASATSNFSGSKQVSPPKNKPELSIDNCGNLKTCLERKSVYS